MDLSYSSEELAFRDEVRAFLASALPKDISAKVKGHLQLTKDDHVRWQRILSEKGWLAAGWPREHGGPGWSVVEQHIFDEECHATGAPLIIPFGLKMVAPVIMKFGTDEQKRRYLPRILTLEDWWCQGYSEPGSGSDLASLRTRAVKEGDHYIVNGQKTWTTLGHFANMIFCLVRTNSEGKPQEGISFLLIDMNTPGITVRPIVLLEGTHEVNEVWFENVKVPVENLVGEEDKGWTCAKYLLTHERTNMAAIGHTRSLLGYMKGIAARARKGAGSLIDDPLFANRLAKVEIDILALEMTTLRVLAQVQGGGAPGPESSFLKIRGTEIRQEIADLARRALGPYGRAFQPDALEDGWNGEVAGPENGAAASMEYFNFRKMSIYGGSNEIQKNIIAKAVLGL